MVFALPGESFYSRLKRVYESNLSQKSFGMDQLFENFNWVNLENGRIKKMSPAEKVHRLIVESEKLRVKNTVSGFRQFEVLKHSSKFVKRYRPVKHCKSCAFEGYHSSVFDFYWIKACPIHREKLTSECPSCGKSWPTVGQLSKRNCGLCGLAPHRTKLNKNYPNGLKIYKPFLRLEYYLNKLIPKKIPNVKIHRFSPNQDISEDRINNSAVLALYSLAHEGIKCDETLELLSMFSVSETRIVKKNSV